VDGWKSFWTWIGSDGGIGVINGWGFVEQKGEEYKGMEN